MKSIDIAALVLPFGLILARVSSFIMSCPTFVADNVPITLRAGLSFLLAIILTLVTPPIALPKSIVVALLVEVGLGLLFGTCVHLVAVAMHFAGDLMDTCVGFSFARQLDPINQTESGPLTRLTQLATGVSFILIDGHQIVIRQLTQSLVLLPPGKAKFDLAWGNFLCAHFDELLTLGVRLAMPIVLSLMGLQLALALLSRLSPAMNIWGIGFVATSGLGVLLLWFYTPSWIAALTQIWRLENTWDWGGR